MYAALPLINMMTPGRQMIYGDGRIADLLCRVRSTLLSSMPARQHHLSHGCLTRATSIDGRIPTSGIAIMEARSLESGVRRDRSIAAIAFIGDVTLATAPALEALIGLR